MGANPTLVLSTAYDLCTADRPMTTETEQLLAPIAAELSEFERRLEASVAADLGPMADAMKHIVHAGGKRLRPALVILSAGLGQATEDHVYDLAMALEFIHTATLIHDDLIDDAPTRRGLATIHEVFGTNAAVIVGDYYFAKGANLMSGLGTPAIDAIVSRAVMTICLGELLQMTSSREYEQTIDDYYRKIERKTAALLAGCAYCGALVGKLPSGDAEAMQRYGYLLGMAFQIADDVLDYTATSAEVGKPVGADFRQGTVTIPLMLALEDPSAGPPLRELLQRPTLDDLDHAEVVRLVRTSAGVDRAEVLAHDFARRARDELVRFPPSSSRATLERLCEYVVDRRI